MSQEMYKEANARWVDQIRSDDPAMVKKAQAGINEYTKTRFREMSFIDRVIPPQTITYGELDRRVDTDNPYKIIDKEPENAPAISVSFGTLPNGYWLRAPRYEIPFDRILTPKLSKDIAQLGTYHMDIRQVVSDNIIKDMASTKDGKVIEAINTMLGVTSTVGAGNGVTVAATGAVQYQSFSGGISRDGVIEGKKIMAKTAYNLRPTMAVCNQVTGMEFEKMTRDEAGGDLSQELLTRGWTEREWFGVQFVVTIKRDIIPDNRIYWFASPEFIGKNFLLEEPSLNVKRESGFMLEMFGYMTLGVGIGNLASIAVSDHT